MRVYDKVSWHIDSGEKENDVLKKFEIIFDFLAKHNMLNDEGREIYDLAGPSMIEC